MSDSIDINVQISQNVTIVGHVCAFLYTQNTLPLIKLVSVLDIIGVALSNVVLVAVYAVMARQIRLVQRRVNAYPTEPIESTTRPCTITSGLTPTFTSNHDSKLDGNTVAAQPTRPSRYERKVTIMLGVITFSSLLSYVPYLIVNLIVRPDSKPETFSYSPAIQLVWRSVMLNSSINPYIIIMFNKRFRNFVSNVLQLKCKNARNFS